MPTSESESLSGGPGDLFPFICGLTGDDLALVGGLIFAAGALAFVGGNLTFDGDALAFVSVVLAFVGGDLVVVGGFLAFEAGFLPFEGDFSLRFFLDFVAGLNFALDILSDCALAIFDAFVTFMTTELIQILEPMKSKEQNTVNIP